MTENYEKLREKRIAERKNLFAELFEEFKKDKENEAPTREKIRTNKKQQASNNDSPFKVEGIQQQDLRKRYNMRNRPTRPPSEKTDSESDTSTSHRISKKKNSTKKSEKKTGKQVLANHNDDPDFRLYNTQLDFKKQYNTRSKRIQE